MLGDCSIFQNAKKLGLQLGEGVVCLITMLSLRILCLACPHVLYVNLYYPNFNGINVRKVLGRFPLGGLWEGILVSSCRLGENLFIYQGTRFGGKETCKMQSRFARELVMRICV